MNYKIYINKTLSMMACVGLVQLVLNNPVMASPAAADLLQACELSLNNGFEGIEGDMCIWYVTPCDCDYGKVNDMPKVCLPESVPVETLARAVVAGLRKRTELHAENADFAAAAILSRVYPCNQ